MSAYGQEGIQRCLQILKEELEQAMRLCGVKSFPSLRQHVNIVGLDRHSRPMPIPHLRMLTSPTFEVVTRLSIEKSREELR